MTSSIRAMVVAGGDGPAVSRSMQVAAITAAAALGLVTMALPAVVEILARDLKFSPEMRGAFGSADYFGIMVGSLSAVLVMRYASPRAVITGALLLLIATDVASTAWGSGESIVTLRVLGGFATGVGSGACAYVWGLKDPGRMSGASQVVANGLSIVMIAASPLLTRDFGWRGVFVCLAIPAFPALILARNFPISYVRPAESQQSLTKTAPSRELLRWVGLAGVMLNSFGASVFWCFLGNMGTEVGLTERFVSTSLSISLMCACIGGLVAAMFGNRFGIKALIITLLLTSAGVAATASAIPWVFAAAVSAFNGGITLFFAVAFGIMMRRAATERFAVHLGAAGATAGSVGPYVGGLILEHWGFGALRGLSLFAILLCGLSYSTYYYFAYVRAPNSTPDRD